MEDRVTEPWQADPESHSRSPFAGASSVVEVRGLRKVYDGLVALAGLDFDLQPGQVLGLVGPNGAGKTTSMRAVCGILPPSAGQVLIAGNDLSRDPVAAKRRLAYVPDDPKLFDALTVWEHLRFTAAAYRVPSFEAAAEDLLARFELTPKRDALAQELSRGMRQKLAICCAYLHDPAVIFLDEPLTGLDPRGIRTMKDSIRQRAGAGTAFVISSHLLSLIEDLCTDLLILSHGRRLFFGGLDEARAAFAGSGETSLEDVFLRATEGAEFAGDRGASGLGLAGRE
jgi:ABC-2 type transport system ATP-binding protein